MPPCLRSQTNSARDENFRALSIAGSVLCRRGPKQQDRAALPPRKQAAKVASSDWLRDFCAKMRTFIPLPSLVPRPVGFGPPWRRSRFPKLVFGAVVSFLRAGTKRARRVFLRTLNLEGDGQADLNVHGGKDNAQLRVRMEVPKDAPLGFHGARLATTHGMSNLRLFCIDDLPQIMEVDSNRSKSTPQAVPIPCVVVGKADAGLQAADGPPTLRTTISQPC